MGLIKAIAAADLNGAIGFGNKLVIHDKDDMRYFVDQTSNNAVVMGRKTFESFGCKPLRRRLNIVITGSPEKYQGNDRVIYTSDLSLKSDFYSEILTRMDIWVIGGASIYKSALPLIDVFHVSRFDRRVEKADTFLPKLSNSFRKKYINRYDTFTVEEWYKI